MDIEKTVIFAFKGQAVCFSHVLLNAIDLHEKGLEGLIVIEGEAVKLIPEMSQSDHALYTLYQKAKSLELISAVCKTCSMTMGVLEAAEAEGLTLKGDMSGHPSMGLYLEEGYQVITL